ncbi:MAG: tryptophan 7-halogenase [Kiloniellales bacterium]
MSERIDQITIIGGGTAGWLTALILQSFLNRRPDQKPVEITVIESPTIPTIGVGEATVRGITNLFRQIGINERDFMRRCNATFKLAAEFVGWNQDEAGDPIYFLHPFNFPKGLDGINPAYHFLRYGSINGKKAAEALTWNQAIITHKKGPRPLGGKDYEAVVSYAYHLDAALFGPFLRETAVERGVIHIADDVVDAEIDEKGHVANLKLQRNGTHPIKLVVDCTGFRSIILQGKLGEEFIPYSQHLLCDRAMPTQIKVPTDRPLPSATRATGLTGGWVFRVPLAERIGTGYIYSSQFKSDDEARDELIQHLRANGDLTPEMEDPEPKVIRMKTGRTRRSWVGNCIAIGLSNGFVEPLEATAIYMVESASRWLVNYFPDQGLDPVYAEAFNRRMDGLYDEVRDFLSMHFVTSNRPEPFWQAAREPGVAPERLMEQLRLWKHTLPSDQDMFYKGLFGEWNYLYCLWEKGYWDSDNYPLSPLATEESWRGFERHIHTATQDLLNRLPDHRALLSEIRGEAEAAQPAAVQPMTGTLMGVGGDGAWQSSQPLYQPSPTAPPAPPTGPQFQPSPQIQAKPQFQPPPAPTPAAYQQAPTQASGGLTYDAAAFGSQPYRPDTPSAPSAPQATPSPNVGLTFGAPPPTQPASHPAGQQTSPPMSPATPPGVGLTFGAATPGQSDSGFAAPLYGNQASAPPTPNPSLPSAGFNAAQSSAPPQPPAEAAKPEPSPFEKALAKRYGKRPTITTPR